MRAQNPPEQTRSTDAAQILEAPLRGLITRCEQRYIKRHGSWSRFVGITQGLSPFLLTKGLPQSLPSLSFRLFFYKGRKFNSPHLQHIYDSILPTLCFGVWWYLTDFNTHCQVAQVIRVAMFQQPSDHLKV